MKKKLKTKINIFRIAFKTAFNKEYKRGLEKSLLELEKNPKRTEIINYLLSTFIGETNYLEIGVRNPEHNFKHIKSTIKKSVDPGIEREVNEADFKMTSDEFFDHLRKKDVDKVPKYNVIFIDGLHLAEQANRDIINAMQFIDDYGYIILHDCNPPTFWHARENYADRITPARALWNGTTWKAFFKWRANPAVHSCCIDTDFGIGILSKKQNIGKATNLQNEFYEFDKLETSKKEYLGLISFSELQNRLNASKIDSSYSS